MAILFALPAACQNQPPAAANLQPPANAQGPANLVQAAAPRDDLAAAELVVRRQLGDPPGLGFAGARVHRDQGVPIVCGRLARDGRSERYIVVDGRGAWVESEMRAGQMDPAFREHCGGRTD